MTAFTEALKERTRERVPLDWAALDDPGPVLAVKGTLRRFAPWTAAGRSEGMAVYEGKGGIGPGRLGPGFLRWWVAFRCSRSSERE